MKKSIEAVEKPHASEKTSFLRSVARATKRRPCPADGGLPKRAAEEVGMQMASKGRFCAAKGFSTASIAATLALLSLSLNTAEALGRRRPSNATKPPTVKEFPPPKQEASHATKSYLDIRHRDPKGVGYETGYTTIDYFLTHRFGKPQFLFNVRGHVFNNAQFAANGGFGFRFPWMNEKLLFGANLFYDFRSAHHILAHQAGAGLEFLHKSVDLRFNGYYPFGGDRSYEEKQFKRFTGNEIIIDQKIVSTLPKIEAEVGLPFGNGWYLAGGPYYLFREKRHGTHLGNAWGGGLRLRLNLGKYLWVEGQVTHDSIFNTRGQGVIALRILGFPAKEKGRNLWNVPIFRSEIIPLEKKKREVALYEGGEDDLFRVLFVDNTFVGGDGTFEAPFSSLKEAEANSQPGDVIYVFPGDGTPHNMDEGIILKEDQLIASSGAPLEMGDVVIPPMTPGAIPSITNIHPDEPVVLNPGDSNLQAFHVIQPWEYLVDSGGRGDGGSDTAVDSNLGVKTPSNTDPDDIPLVVVNPDLQAKALSDENLDNIPLVVVNPDLQAEARGDTSLDDFVLVVVSPGPEVEALSDTSSNWEVLSSADAPEGDSNFNQADNIDAPSDSDSSDSEADE